MEESNVNPVEYSSEAKRSKVRRAFDKLESTFIDVVDIARQGSKRVVLFNGSKEVLVTPYFDGADLSFFVSVLNKEGACIVSPVQFRNTQEVIESVNTYLVIPQGE